MTRNVVYVELDAILDTRLAAISRISSKAAADLVTDDRYYTRLTDDFTQLCGITREQFREEYTKRDASLIYDSLMTELPHLLRELVSKLEVEASETPFMENFEVHLNVWPYVLEAETEHALEVAMLFYSGRETPVRIVRMHPKDVTPTYIKSTVSGMILYNFRDWLQHHLDAFAIVQCPRVTILAPALFHEDPPKPDEFDTEGLRKGLDPFQLAELNFIEWFALQLLEPGLFSLYRPSRVRRKPPPESK